MRGCRSQLSVLGVCPRSCGRPRSRGALQVTAAITRQKKEQIVETVKTKLESSALVFGMSINGLTVQQMEELRGSLSSEHTSVYICKNSLMKIAIQQVDGWSTLRPVAKNENAWIFVDEDGIASTVKSWLDFEKVQTKVLKDNAEKGEVVGHATEIYGGAVKGKYCTPEDIIKFKDLPTKHEALVSLLGTLNAMPVALLSTLNQAPVQLAFSVDRIAELDEEKTRLVREFVKSGEDEESSSS